MKKYLSIITRAMAITCITGCVQTPMHFGEMVEPAEAATLTVPDNLTCAKINNKSFVFKDPHRMTFSPGIYTVRIEMLYLNIHGNAESIQLTAEAGHHYEVRSHFYTYDRRRRIVHLKDPREALQGKWIAYIYDLTERCPAPSPEIEKNKLIEQLISSNQ